MDYFNLDAGIIILEFCQQTGNYTTPQYYEDRQKLYRPTNIIFTVELAFLDSDKDFNKMLAECQKNIDILKGGNLWNGPFQKLLTDY